VFPQAEEQEKKQDLQNAGRWLPKPVSLGLHKEFSTNNMNQHLSLQKKNLKQKV